MSGRPGREFKCHFPDDSNPICYVLKIQSKNISSLKNALEAIRKSLDIKVYLMWQALF